MKDNIEQSLPESDISEWKASWNKHYLKWLCAYANTDGGVLSIGVNDDGYIMGLVDYRHLLEEIPNTIRNKLLISPRVRLRWTEKRGVNIRYKDSIPDSIASVDFNKYVCGTYQPRNEREQKKLDNWTKVNPVVQDHDGRYYYIEISIDPYPNLITYDGVAYSRSGSTLQIIEGLELEKRVLASAGMSWDEFPASNKKLTVADLNKSTIDLFRKNAVKKKRISRDAATASDEGMIGKLHLLTKKDEMTRAAVMLFGDPESVVVGSYIKIGYFAPVGSRGMNTGADVAYHDDVHGPLLEQPGKAIDLLYSKYMKALISYNGLQREETYMIPEEAMREILLNAVAHKFYPSGNPIQVKVYDDHMTIMNEGFWPFEKIRVEDAYTEEHNSYRNNPLIADGIYMFGEVEGWGRGFEKIRNACLSEGVPLPEIKATKGSVTIVVHASEKYMELLNKMNGNVDGVTGQTDSGAESPRVDSRRIAYNFMREVLSKELKESEKKKILPLVEYFESHDEISAEEAAVLIQKSVSTATRYLNRMIELKTIDKVGTTNGVTYRIII